MIPPKSNSAPKKLPPAGTHIGRVIEILYEGTQIVSYQGQDKEQPKVRIKWEIPFETEVFKEGDPAKPFVVNSEFTLSMYSKGNLRPIAEGIIGVQLKDEEADSFDVDFILGKPSLITIAHKEGKNGKYAIVSSTSPLMKGQSCPPPFNPMKVLSFDKWDENLYQSLPDFLKEKIAKSPEYKALKGEMPAPTVSGDSVTPIPKGETLAYPSEEINPNDIPF